MLPRSRRLRSPGDFTETFRNGSRAGTKSVVVHVAVGNDNPPAPRVGFVVSKAVGNAVVRNRVKRRLRHLVATLDAPAGARIVVRALPPAVTNPNLADDLRFAWDKALRRITC